jgi:dihydroorotate dehydrogenase
MLICSGVIQLLTGLWGIRANQPWFWWTLALAGVAGYTPAIAVHFAVDYTDLGHLVPAFAGLGAYLSGLALLGPYMLRTKSNINSWSKQHATVQEEPNSGRTRP